MSVGNAATHNKELQQLRQAPKHSEDRRTSTDGLHSKVEKVTICGKHDQTILTNIL